MLSLFGQSSYRLVVVFFLGFLLINEKIPLAAAAPWYSCGAQVSYSTPTPTAGMNVTNKTFCSSDGDGKSQVISPGSVPTSGTYGCYCYDAVAPTISATANPAPPTWTNQAVAFNGTIANQTADGSPYSSASYTCPGWSAVSLWSAATFNFSCTSNSATTQNAQIKSCDTAGNCATSNIAFLKEIIPPTVSIANISGTKHNHNGTTDIGDSASTAYTYTPAVTLNISAADTGGSGIKSVLASCSSVPPTLPTDSRWQSYSAAIAFNLATSNGCTASEGVKTVYLWSLDNAGNISTAPASSSIVYDNTPPSFDTYPGTILLQATSSYSYTLENPSDIGGIRDFSVRWVEWGVPLAISPDIPYPATSYNFGNIAQLVSWAKRSATISIVMEDNAGNISAPKTQSIDVIAAGNIASPTIRTITPMRGGSSTAWANMTADLKDYYEYSMVLKDQYGNIIRPVDNIRSIQPNWSIANSARFIDGSDGAVLYSWDTAGTFSDILGNTSPSMLFTNSTNKTDGRYALLIYSSVPTIQGYAGYATGDIQISSLAFQNTLPCPANYRCSWMNTGVASVSLSLGDVVGLGSLSAAPWALTGLITQPIAFRPIVDIILSKSFNVMTDNTWHDISVELKNNSVTEDFTLDQYRLELRYTADLYGFADAEIQGDFGSYSSISSEPPKSIPFSIIPALAIPHGADIVKNIQIRTNTYGVGFGQFGFISYIPYISGMGNKIAAVHPTGYNTRNLSINPLPGYSYGAIPIASSEFTDGESVGQKIAVQGLLGDRKAGNTANTLENAIQVDVSSINITEFKSSVQRNAAEMIRWLKPDNAAGVCNANLPTTLSKDVYYYDFSDSANVSDINGNKGCILTIGGSPTAFGSSTFNTRAINGKKTIIVRWWNVMINADMFYTGSDSMLALVVLRNDADRTLGWDIFIHPDVTNGVGGVYADGSIMSYDGATLYDSSNTHEWDLARQFLWYGSIFSSNSIGGAFKAPYECPYNSDTYVITKVKTCSQVEASRYDLAFLRRFVTINGSGGNCASATERAAKSSGTDTLDYAFAGKRQCYQTDAPNQGLKGSSKTTPTVIEYNPAVQTSGMKIFSAQ